MVKFGRRVESYPRSMRLDGHVSLFLQQLIEFDEFDRHRRVI